MKLYAEVAKDDPILFSQFCIIRDEIDSIKVKLDNLTKWMEELTKTYNKDDR